MRLTWPIACAVAAAWPYALAHAQDRHAPNRHAYDSLIAAHAQANLVPEALVHRVIVRESKYNPDLVGRGGTIGLMQIKLATARGVGFSGDAGALRDPETNLTYGIKYLAGAWRAAQGNHDLAMRYFAGGYYYVAKQQRRERLMHAATPTGVPPQPLALAAKPDDNARANAAKNAGESAKELDAAVSDTKPLAAPKRKSGSRKSSEAKVEVPAPAATGDGANNVKPR